MPARPSPHMPSRREQLVDVPAPVAPETIADLRTYLIEAPDPRARHGVRHPWTAPLAAAASAVLSGAASGTKPAPCWTSTSPYTDLARDGICTGTATPP